MRMKVNRMEQYANRPQFVLEVEDAPGADELRYEERNGCYFAEKDGLVRFFYYTKPDDGYGGTVFPITMTDGRQVDLIGPWSSRSGVMNGLGFAPCLEVVINGRGAAVTVAWLESQGVTCKAINSNGETIYEPLDENGDLYKPLSHSYTDIA